MADRDIAVKFTGDSRDLERAADKADRSISDTGKSMGSTLSSLAGPAAIAGGAIIGLGMVAADFAQAALEDDAAASQLAHQLKQAAGASDEAVAGAEAYIAALSKTVAIADDDLRPALSKLATATGDTAKAQDLLALATDISAGTGKDLAAVTDALVKAQLGSTGGLSKMGIATKDAEGNALSLEETLAKARDTFHGAGEAAAQTAAGGLRNAQIQIGELQESIGAKMLPVLGALADVFVSKVIPAFEGIVAWVEAEWPKIMEQIAPDLAELQALVAEVMADVAAAWDEWGDDVARVAGLIVAFWIEEMVIKLKIFVAVVRFVVDQVKAFWAEWGDTIITVVNVAVAALEVLQAIFTRVATVIGFVWFSLSAALRGDWATAWGNIKAAAGEGLDFVLGIFRGMGAQLAAAMGNIAERIVAPFRAAFQAIADLWNRTVGSLSFEFPSWIPGLGGNRIEVPDIPRASTFAGLTIVMPPGSDGYDVARQVTSFSRNVAPMGALTVAVR